MLLDDVDRIEAIRGPGATVWGANAVNGVSGSLARAGPFEHVAQRQAHSAIVVSDDDDEDEDDD